jgi:hypothetical protein
MVICSVQAGAAVQIFHSPGDDGVPATGPATIAEGGVQTVFLYIDGGPTASAVDAACDVGVGDEVCGYELALSGIGGLTLASFNADPGADVMVALSAGSIAIGGLDTVAPAAGPKRIGELNVNSVAGGELALTGGEAVGADLTSETILPGTVVTVPEPMQVLLLGSGLILLASLHARRAS